ncbi:MAG TPA: helix-turn-helix transcriptional regulator [Pseudonocardiaceae bacterium]|jgi:transcriptional regulator with XRE-family HTH domain|nr:helix-turn-helix transcriptional regulator [Pseudonocardiaceae bacterium]
MVATGGVGARVAEERKLAGLTQHQLATRATVSVSLIRAVEQGRRPASPAFVSAVGRALGIGVADLLDQPFVRETRSERERAFWLLGEAYCAAWQVVYKFGLPGATWIWPRSPRTATSGPQRAAGTSWRCRVATTGARAS